MAQKMLEAQQMPELQLRQELRSRFPEINGPTVMKVMKMYNNDTEKCIQHLEQESQKSLFGAPTDTNSPPPPSNHNNNFSHTPGNNVSKNNSNHPPSSVGNVLSGSQASGGMSRYQELPVKHEIESTHISTVQHTIGPPTVPPKPLPSKPDKSALVHPIMPPVHSPLFIDPVNQGDPHQTPQVRPNDFAPFMGASPRKHTDIPNIRCGPTSSGADGASGGSPESRRPVRVISVQGFTSGGTVTSGTIMSPTSSSTNPGFKVVLGDGGGLCLMHGSSTPITLPSSTSSPHKFSGSAYVQPQTLAPEPEQHGIHSSSIFINPAINPRRTDIQQESCIGSSAGAHSHFKVSTQYMDSQGPTSFPVPGTTQPLTVSVSSIATTQQGPSERGQNFAFQGFTSTSGYSAGFSNAAPPFSTSGIMNAAGGGGSWFAQEAASPSPPRPFYPIAGATHGISQMSLSPGSVATGPSPPAHSSPSPNMMGVGMGHTYGAMSPAQTHKSPSLQHQRSTGSSTSRSDSMESEQGSTHHPTEPLCDPPHPSHPTHPSYPQRGMVGIVGMGVPMLSPASSQSSLSSESSARDRDPNSVPRQRSGSMQEEAAYSQALLHHQQQRMDKLTNDIEIKRKLLNQLREEVSEAEKSKIVKNSLRTTFPTADDIATLCESNRRLQTDIQMYLNEIDMYKNGQTPFSVIDPMGQQNFFNNMPTGPNDLFSRPPVHRPRTPPPPPPPRPPPLRAPLHRHDSNDLTTQVPPPASGQTQGGGSADSEEGERWACSACTFENHPALKKCEICEMPRLMTGRDGAGAGAGMGMVGSVSMPQLHHLGGMQGVHPHLLHRGAGGEVCYCHNLNCQQKLHKL